MDRQEGLEDYYHPLHSLEGPDQDYLDVSTQNHSIGEYRNIWVVQVLLKKNEINVLKKVLVLCRSSQYWNPIGLVLSNTWAPVFGT